MIEIRCVKKGFGSDGEASLLCIFFMLCLPGINSCLFRPAAGAARPEEMSTASRQFPAAVCSDPLMNLESLFSTESLSQSQKPQELLPPSWQLKMAPTLAATLCKSGWKHNEESHSGNHSQTTNY